MTRRSIAMSAAVLFTVLSFAALASSDPGGRGPAGPAMGGPGMDAPGMGGARHLFPPPGYLDLTDEQTQAVGALRESVRAQLRGVREDGRSLRDQLRAALESDAPDVAQVGRLVIDLHGHRQRVRAIFKDAESQLTALLNEEQLEKWDNFKELREHRRGPRHRERMRGFGDDGPGQS